MFCLTQGDSGILNYISLGATPEETARALTEEYDVDLGTAATDVQNTAASLVEAGAAMIPLSMRRERARPKLRPSLPSIRDLQRKVMPAWNRGFFYSPLFLYPPTQADLTILWGGPEPHFSYASTTTSDV